MARTYCIGLVSILALFTTPRLASAQAQDYHNSAMRCTAERFVYQGTAGHRYTESNGHFTARQYYETVFCDIVTDDPGDMYYVRVIVAVDEGSQIACNLHSIWTFDGAFGSSAGPTRFANQAGESYLYLYPPSAPGADLAHFITCDMQSDKDALLDIWVNN